VPDGYTPILTLSDDGETVFLGAPSSGDPRVKMLVAGLDRKHRTVVWQRELDTRDVHVDFDMAEGRLVVWAKKLTAIDAKSGNVLWEVGDVPRDDGVKSSVLAVTKTRVYVREVGRGRPLQVREASSGKLIGAVKEL